MKDPSRINGDIGFDAGSVYHHLSNRFSEDSIEVSSLSGEIDLSIEHLFMAVGWLAREGKVIVLEGENSIEIHLAEGDHGPIPGVYRDES